MKISSYKDLTVWQKSMDLVKEIYKITKELPRSEIYGLSSQMQRAAVAIPSNIAEGSKRNHKLEYIQFLSIANGSAAELETQINLIKSIYPQIDTQKAESLLNEILKMLHVIITKLNNN